MRRRESAAAKPPPSGFSGPRRGLVTVTGASRSRVGAEQRLAVAAAKQEDKPLQVITQLDQAVGGVADGLCQGVAQAGGAAGHPAPKVWAVLRKVSSGHYPPSDARRALPRHRQW